MKTLMFSFLGRRFALTNAPKTFSERNGYPQPLGVSIIYEMPLNWRFYVLPPLK